MSKGANPTGKRKQEVYEKKMRNSPREREMRKRHRNHPKNKVNIFLLEAVEIFHLVQAI
jgi:hypothetical protein